MVATQRSFEVLTNAVPYHCILTNMQIGRSFRTLFLLLVLLAASYSGSCQELNTAKSYWVETNKENYKQILWIKERGDSLTANQSLYLQDYGV